MNLHRPRNVGVRVSGLWCGERLCEHKYSNQTRGHIKNTIKVEFIFDPSDLRRTPIRVLLCYPCYVASWDGEEAGSSCRYTVWKSILKTIPRVSYHVVGVFSSSTLSSFLELLSFFICHVFFLSLPLVQLTLCYSVFFLWSFVHLGYPLTNTFLGFPVPWDIHPVSTDKYML